MRGVTQRGDRFYIRFFDANKKRRCGAAKGARTVEEAHAMLTEIERAVMLGSYGAFKERKFTEEEVERACRLAATRAIEKVLAKLGLTEAPF